MLGDGDLFVEFGRRLPDGKKLIDEQACLESLARLEAFAGNAFGEGGKEYYLVAPRELRRTPKGEGLRLTKAKRA